MKINEIVAGLEPATILDYEAAGTSSRLHAFTHCFGTGAGHELALHIEELHLTRGRESERITCLTDLHGICAFRSVVFDDPRF